MTTTLETTATRAAGSPPPPRRRVAVLVAAAVLGVALVTATVTIARFAPLAPGSGSGPVTATVDAWITEPVLGDRTVVIVRDDGGGELDVRVSLTNTGPVTVAVDLDRTLVDLRAASDPGCAWRADRLQAVTTGWGGEPAGDVLPATFGLDPGQHVLLDLEGTIGSGDGPSGCVVDALVARELDVPVRYTVAGLARTQVVATGYTLALSDDPEAWLTPEVTPVEAPPP